MGVMRRPRARRDWACQCLLLYSRAGADFASRQQPPDRAKLTFLASISQRTSRARLWLHGCTTVLSHHRGKKGVSNLDPRLCVWRRHDTSDRKRRRNLADRLSPALRARRRTAKRYLAGQARTDCYLGLSQLYRGQSDLAAARARAQSDAAWYRAITGTDPPKQKPHRRR
jgi:hypothetical protein